MAQRCFNLSNITRHLLFVIRLLYMFYTNVLELSARLLMLSKLIYKLSTRAARGNFIIVDFIVANFKISKMFLNFLGFQFSRSISTSFWNEDSFNSVKNRLIKLENLQP